MSARRGRIVMLTHDVRIDRRILLQAEALIADGWTLLVVAMPTVGDEPDPEWVRRIPATEHGRNRALLAAYAACRRLLPMNGVAMRWMKAFAWAWVVDPETFFLRSFEPVLRDAAADVIVVHDLPMLPVGVRLAERSGAALVFDSHELWCEQNFPHSWRDSWQQVERRHIGRCDAVLTVNHSIAAELRRRYDLGEVKVITNAAPEPPAMLRSLRDRCGVPSGGRVLLYQGSLSAGRQLPECVEAMHRLEARDVHLVMLGDGALRSRLQRLARVGSARGRIHILPAVPQQELLAWTASADAGLVPYVADCMNSELCTPNKLFEFIAAGLPILASDLPELRAIIAGHGFGMVSEFGSPRQIARSIDEFMADSTRLAAWQTAVVSGRLKFGWSVQAERLRYIFRRFEQRSAPR
jgi:glycosyltransferase involved in cell wall biosynthesis